MSEPLNDDEVDPLLEDDADPLCGDEVDPPVDEEDGVPVEFALDWRHITVAEALSLATVATTVVVPTD